MSWDINATVALVEKHFGRTHGDAAKACINSVNQRVRYAEFHYFAIKDELEAFQAKLGDRFLLSMIGSADEEEFSYYAFMDRVGAHAVACVQSIHALEDLLSATVYRCLNLDTMGNKTLDEHQLSLPNTIERLKKQANYATVQALLGSLKLNPSFAHIDALSNKAKHSAIVRPWISQDQTGTRADPLLLYFEEFTRKTIVYPEKPFSDLLAPALNFAANVRVDVGIELTSLLK